MNVAVVVGVAVGGRRVMYHGVGSAGVEGGAGSEARVVGGPGVLVLLLFLLQLPHPDVARLIPGLTSGSKPGLRLNK